MLNKTFEDFRLLPQAPAKSLVELVPLSPVRLEAFMKRASHHETSWLKDNFTAAPDEQAYRVSSSGRTVSAYVTVPEPYQDEGIAFKSVYDDRFILAQWAHSLFPGRYSLSRKLNLSSEQKHGLVLGWGLAAYEFGYHKTHKVPKNIHLKIPDDVDTKRLYRELAASYFVQDLINQPPNIINCEGLTEEAQKLAIKFGANMNVIRGERLREDKANFPLIYAVGKGSREEPRLIDIQWGDPSKPRVTLVGKGVVFDTGGLNNKDADQMRTMKYDMAGAAHALGVAYMAMDAQLPISLRVLLPVVENANSPTAYKQGEKLNTRMGKTLEVTNTDAEGRLIMSDALYEASHPSLRNVSRPDLIMSYGTLGWYGFFEYPGWGTVISNKLHVQHEFQRTAAECQEYFAPRPLLRRLGKELENSLVADLRQHNDDHSQYDDLLVANLLHMNIKGGKGKEPDWVYNDLQPWRAPNTTTTLYPENLPDGAFAQGVRTSFRMIESRYG